MTNSTLHKTSLNDWHRQHGGRMVEFAGWEMPIQYSTITEEHHAVRRQCGLFDISHMGRLEVRGRQAAEFLNSLVTIDVSRLSDHRIRYALATNSQGGIRDDILVYRQADAFLVVVNASNREKIVEFWSSRLSRFPEAVLEDRTLQTSMIAVQGPEAAGIMRTEFPGVEQLKYYRCQSMIEQGSEIVVSRTGYTGEDGFEIIGSHDFVSACWQRLFSHHQKALRPCGLGCRDTLRLEAGMPLYGHELSEEIDPLAAGLAFAVDLGKSDFEGREELNRIRTAGPRQQRVGLELEGRRIAREGATILNNDGKPVGEVTSGTFSPTLERSIAMGYVPVELAAPGTSVTIDIRGKGCPACVSEIPFYRKGKG
ncbi:glycine cleavage system aminomethyltransferase GcvT [Rubinisphaera margarita]|uniref:glycine cleavage system aminomethyltransferase GcvT n=1 Tax=Rubinisphaera margarita TaxID=2909586 RepID=UPI001EE90DED|nr:glycine cleavage system aminomethyltransferase GcvT [Rubinisphaera margarita]MCG6156042.1 glycine cleavage system aminomethyltransferase GcvT [Rubinisphaera margarita]